MRAFNIFVSIVIATLVATACSTESTPVYQLTVSSNPSEAGTVTPASVEYEEGEQVEISATANDHWVFTGWQGDHSGSTTPTTITMDSDKSIRAMFAKQEYPLTIETIGEGTVEERVVEQKTTDYEHGTTVELTAVPSEGWAFIRWEGDRESQENPLIITVEEETNITAIFERVEYPLTVTIVGEGEVDEQVVQSKTTDYPGGTIVELTANPAEDWAFSKWSGDLDGEENPATITIDEPREVTATFLRSYTLTTNASPEEGGTVTPEPGKYVQDTTIEVETEANQGWEFVEWEGDFSGTVNPFNLTMNANKTITANFERKDYELNTVVEGQGNISEQLISGTASDKGYSFESEVKLEALADENWNFSHWEGDLSGSENPINVTFNKDLNVTAVFIEFEDGDGSIESPFQVANLYQLRKVKDYLDKHFLQISDINAEETGNQKRESDLEEGFEPIGTQEHPFTGSYNGQNYEINNLYIRVIDEDPNFKVRTIGLFGNNNGLLKNIELNINIEGTFKGYVGGLVGLNYGEVINTKVIGEISSKSNSIDNFDEDEASYIGGVSGLNKGVISESSSDCLVRTSADNPFNNVGGFTGRNDGDIIESNSSNYGSLVSDREESISAGFVGLNTGHILRSYSTADIKEDGIKSGFVNSNKGLIEDSYSNGILEHKGLGVINSNSSAGLVFHNTGEGQIINSYYSGEINDYGESTMSGGLVGINSGNAVIFKSYTKTSTEVRSAGEQEAIAGGLVAINKDNAVVIRSYTLGTVSGSYSSITIGGLVGENYARITQSFSNANVFGGGEFRTVLAGGLVGKNGGEINEAYSSGDVDISLINARGYVGGLVGNNDGIISESFTWSKITVSTYSDGSDKVWVGGLAGINFSDLSNTYSTGDISIEKINDNPTVIFGGSVGAQKDQGTANNIYWDLDNSGFSNGVGDGKSGNFIGLETGEMTGSNAEVNMDFNWDNIWKTVPGSYPIFQWQDE